jgi:hypothetical protein
MQERSDGSFFVQLVLGGKSKRVDSAKFVIGRIGDRAFDGSSAATVGRLPQNTKESFRLAHRTPLAPLCSLSRQGSCRDKACAFAVGVIEIRDGSHLL